MKLRLLKLALKFVVVLIVVAAATTAYVFYRAMPAYSGAVVLPGLSGETRVWRDAYGAPHIFAPNLDDAARALGYLHASERLYQMEVNRRAGQGRLAELAGPSLLSVDRFIRTLGLYKLAESSFAALSPWAQARMQAYSDGVNAFLDSHANALPPEFLILGDKPEPWTPADSLVWGKIMSLQLSGDYKMDALRAHVAKTLPADQAGWLLPPPNPDWPITTAPALHSDHAQADHPPADHPQADHPFERLGALTGLGHGASNEWIIAGSRTVTGKPILANDPHLDLAAPILWYLARIVTPDGWVKGATVPGLPLVLLGQTDHIAWGLTTSDTDAQDLFIETVDPADPTHYLTPDGSQAFATHDEVIHVKGGADVTLHVRATRHGPVISDIDAGLAALAGTGKVIALGFTGLGDHDASAEALLRVNVAKNWSEFLDALKTFETPTQNFAFAAVDGDIGFISPGLLPIRKSGDGSLPADGASGTGDWTGTLPFEQWPQLHNPDAGLIFNGNNAIVAPDQFAKYGRDWEEAFRARRMQQMFDAASGKHSLDDSAAMQADVVSLAAKDLLPFLKVVTPSDERARQALALLAAWDGAMDQDRPEPLIYSAFPQRPASHHAGREDRPDAQRNGTIRCPDAGVVAARPSGLVRRARQARPRLPRDAGARAR
jgi:penicillin amidase